MVFVKVRCPYCNNTMQVDREQEAHICQYCEKFFVTETAICDVSHIIGENGELQNNEKEFLQKQEKLEEKLSQLNNELQMTQSEFNEAVHTIPGRPYIFTVIVIIWNIFFLDTAMTYTAEELFADYTFWIGSFVDLIIVVGVMYRYYYIQQKKMNCYNLKEKLKDIKNQIEDVNYEIYKGNHSYLEQRNFK